MNTTPLPSTRFVLVRNPYFHRVDASGRQLPYIDRVIVGISDDKLIPAKAGAGDVDLQARYLRFDNYTFLKQNEKRNSYRVLLWEKVLGSQIALYPNLNVDDPEWRKLMRDVALPPRAVARDQPPRDQRGRVLRPRHGKRATPCCRAARCTARSSPTRGVQFDPKAANALLDELGLTQARRDRPPPAAGRPPDGDRRSTPRARAPRRPTFWSSSATAGGKVGIAAVLPTVAARGVPQARVLRQVDDVGLVGSRQRHSDAGDELRASSPRRRRSSCSGRCGASTTRTTARAARRPTCRKRWSSWSSTTRGASRPPTPSARRSGCACSRSTRSRCSRSASSPVRCSRSS